MAPPAPAIVALGGRGKGGGGGGLWGGVQEALAAHRPQGGPCRRRWGRGLRRAARRRGAPLAETRARGRRRTGQGGGGELPLGGGWCLGSRGGGGGGWNGPTLPRVEGRRTLTNGGRRDSRGGWLLQRLLGSCTARSSPPRPRAREERASARPYHARLPVCPPARQACRTTRPRAPRMVAAHLPPPTPAINGRHGASLRSSTGPSAQGARRPPPPPLSPAPSPLPSLPFPPRSFSQ